MQVAHSVSEQSDLAPKLGLPLGGHQAKITTKPKMGEGFITCSKPGEHEGFFPSRVSPEQQSWEVLS